MELRGVGFLGSKELSAARLGNHFCPSEGGRHFACAHFSGGCRNRSQRPCQAQWGQDIPRIHPAQIYQLKAIGPYIVSGFGRGFIRAEGLGYRSLGDTDYDLRV